MINSKKRGTGTMPIVEYKRRAVPAVTGVMASKAKERSDNYEGLSAEEQWDEDKRLGILDWDGSPGK